MVSRDNSVVLFIGFLCFKLIDLYYLCKYTIIYNTRALFPQKKSEKVESLNEKV